MRSDAIWQALCLLAIDTRLAEGYTSHRARGLALHQTALLDAMWFIYGRAGAQLRASRRSGAWRPRARRRAPTVSCSSILLWPTYEQAPAELVASLRREVARKGDGEHDFKFFGVAEAIATPLPTKLQGRWWAAASFASSVGSSQRWSRADEATALIEGADIVLDG